MKRRVVLLPCRKWRVEFTSVGMQSLSVYTIWSSKSTNPNGHRGVTRSCSKMTSSRRWQAAAINRGGFRVVPGTRTTISGILVVFSRSELRLPVLWAVYHFAMQSKFEGGGSADTPPSKKTCPDSLAHCMMNLMGQPHNSMPNPTFPGLFTISHHRSWWGHAQQTFIPLFLSHYSYQLSIFRTSCEKFDEANVTSTRVLFW